MSTEITDQEFAKQIAGLSPELQKVMREMRAENAKLLATNKAQAAKLGEFETEISEDTITLRLKIIPAQSESGKSLVLASSHGNKDTGQTYNGKTVYAGVNVFVKNDKVAEVPATNVPEIKLVEKAA